MTGVTTVADFRVGDMAAGGQGAPLVPYADWALFTHPTRARIVQNIGGIGNLTFLPPRAELDDVVAFDTGPGNMLIDAVVAQLTGGRMIFDRDGRLAARGTVSERLLGNMMSHPYLAKRPPKTTGREEFGEEYVRHIMEWAGRSHHGKPVPKIGAERQFRPTGKGRERLRDEDIVATATAFTAASIANAYERFVFPELDAGRRSALQVILGGGGAKNPTLRRMLAERLGGAELLTHEDFGLANAAKEALAFAILAHETLLGHPGNVPAATGARRPVVLGKIVVQRLPRC
jgi:anhydro-N-acetylmuramic acid kinase